MALCGFAAAPSFGVSQARDDTIFSFVPISANYFNRCRRKGNLSF
jgi:hypothetical protein